MLEKWHKMNNHNDYNTYYNSQGRFWIEIRLLVSYTSIINGYTKGIVKYKNLYPRSLDHLVSSLVGAWTLPKWKLVHSPGSAWAHCSYKPVLQTKSVFRRTNLVLQDSLNEYWSIWFCRWIHYRSEGANPTYSFYFFKQISLYGRSGLRIQQRRQVAR